MAKSRAQRKAERRAREQQQKQGDSSEQRSSDESRAQHDTQVPRSGEIAEFEAVEEGIEAGASEEDLETPDAPAPRRQSRAEKREEKKRQKEAEKQEIEERRKKGSQGEVKRKQQQAGHQRGGVIGFLISCWAELKRVQWPDRETLIQASAVTVIFVAIAAAYLGALDWVFSEVMQFIL